MPSPLMSVLESSGEDCQARLSLTSLYQAFFFFFFLNCQVMSDSLVTSCTVPCQAPLSMGYSKEEF